MGLFDNSFFSFSGQQERLLNVFETEKAVLTNIVNTVTLGAVGSQTNIVATNPSSHIGKIGEAIANNPLTTAGAIVGAKAIVANSATIGSAIADTSLKTKVITAIAAPVVLGAVAANPGGTAKTVLNAPSSLATFGTNIGAFTNNPSVATAATIAKESPVLTTIVGVGGTALLLGGLGSAASTVATSINTKAVNNSTNSGTNGNKEIGTQGPANNIQTSAADNGHTEDIAKAQADASVKIAEANAKAGLAASDATNKANIEIAKINAQVNQDTLNAQLKALDIQSKTSTLPTSSTVTKKSTTKKKAVKKKKKPTKKKKTIKKKNNKRK